MDVPASVVLEQISAGTAPTILDVRSRAEYSRGHVPGAVHVPFWMLRCRLRSIPGTPQDPVVVYCGHGPRAWFVGAWLRRRGFTNVRYLEGHFNNWRANGLPEES